MEKYIIRKIQVIYSDGSRDKVTLMPPIATNDKEAVRTRLLMRYNSLGKHCKGVNLEMDEFNDDFYDVDI